MSGNHIYRADVEMDRYVDVKAVTSH